MSELVYQMQGVTKAYQGKTVLQVDALDVHRGEILALVGPSGAGKSTLLRLLNMIEPPTKGTIRFLGRTFDSQQQAPLELRRRVTMVFQRPVLLSRSVQANVAYGLQLRGRRRVDRQVREALESVGLADLSTQDARTLSGGEAQRVALARAMILEPDVLLLDEPTANLDPYNVGLIEDTIRQINQRGATLVMVTHNVFQARRLAHRVALILGGKIIEVGDTQSFFHSPRDKRTAAFVVGDMVY
jgi:tungstate transport system ATP-binding protein